ncbi:hypothetical protein NESM_000014600 [Novymonas esmeraldas]|uniref:Uncharacterized protein n=1 Tax=Novymonas esmeraldas TaxID=1808958 RepID=A0AAW0F0V0_9TRYP
MNPGGDLERAWDPAAPGAGAIRATAIAQLYFRMTSHHPLTILAVDALALVFGAEGVTVQELVDYLGVTEDRVRFGLEGIPSAMRCTARQLESEGSGVTASPSVASGGGGNGDGASAGVRDQLANGDPKAQGTRYFLDYKRMLPLVYAHVTRLLLSACVVDVPPCRYVQQVTQARLATYQRPDSSTAHAFFASSGFPHASEARVPSGSAGASGSGTGDHVDVSEAMQRKSAIRGVSCLGCSCYFLPEEFYETLTRCPRCGKDSLRLCLHVIQRQLQARAAEQPTLATLLPPVRQAWKLLASRAPATKAAPPAAAGRGAAASTPSLDCALARDPFLFQQAVAFLSLYSTRFASVNDAAAVVDVQEILTEPEYRDRLRGRSSPLADQFRSRHRHAASVHVRLLPQHEVDAARQQASHQKLLKRAMLPPWLRHTSALEDLGGTHAYSSASVGGAAATTPTEKKCDPTTTPPREHVHGHVPTGGAVWTAADSSSVVAPPAQKRQRATTADGRGGAESADTVENLTRAAAFIAAHYYDDEYDEVRLPQSRRARHTKPRH